MKTYSFSDDVRTVLARARDAAQTRDQEYVGAEHILLGLLDAPDDRCSAVLAQFHTDAAAVKRAVGEALGAPVRAPGGISEVPFTSHAKKVLEHAMHEARTLGHNAVMPEHLLLALMLLDPSRVPALARLALDPNAARDAIARLAPPPSTGHAGAARESTEPHVVLVPPPLGTLAVAVLALIVATVALVIALR